MGELGDRNMPAIQAYLGQLPKAFPTTGPRAACYRSA
jgi:hypothetical protein